MESFPSVWDALEPAPDSAAAWMLRSNLMLEIRAVIDHRRLTPAQAAQHLAITETEIHALSEGHIDAFSLDRLVAIAHRAGIAIRLEPVGTAA